MSKSKAIGEVRNYTVVQANDLIRNKKDFSLWELRVFALLASHVRKEDDDFFTYKFRIRDLLDLFETNSNNLYDELRAIPEKLHAKIIRLPYTDEAGKQRVRRYNLISMSDFPDEGEIDEGESIMLRFDKDLKPLLLKLGEHFTVYKFVNVLKLRSPYIFQLYELLKSEEYRGRQSVDIDLAEFRDILQVPESYKFGNIQQRILRPAQKQFAEFTDINFDFEPMKGRGGKIKKLRFRIYKNKPGGAVGLEEAAIEPKAAVNAPPPGSGGLFAELYPSVRQWLAEDVFKKLVAEYPEGQVRNAVRYTLNRLEKGETIENIGGYIVAMAKQTMLFDQLQERKDKDTAKKQAELETARRREELESRKKELYQEVMRKEDAIMEAIFIEFPEARAAAIDSLKHNAFASYDPRKSEAENFQNPSFAAAYRTAVRKSYAQRFEALDKQYQPKIKSIKAEIALL